MKDSKKIEQLAEQALRSLDNVQQLEPNDFLAAKAWHRMQGNRQSIPSSYNKLLFRLAAVLLVFVGINCASFYVLGKKSTDTASTATGVNAFASAYGISNNSYNY